MPAYLRRFVASCFTLTVPPEPRHPRERYRAQQHSGDPRPDPGTPASFDVLDFPAAIDDRYCQAKRIPIEWLDPDAVCALASRFSNGAPCRIVGQKLGCFNAASSFRFTAPRSPPLCYAYGLVARLTKTSAGTQIFLVTRQDLPSYDRRTNLPLFPASRHLGYARKSRFPFVGLLEVNLHGNLKPTLNIIISLPATIL